MAIPLIIAGAVAAITGAAGVGAVLSAKEKINKAKEIYNSGKRKQTRYQNDLEKQHKKQVEAAKNLGILKLQIEKNEIARFVNLYEKIQTLNIQQIKSNNFSFKLSNTEIKQLKNLSVNAKDVLEGGIQSIGTGALVGAGIYNGVMLLGTASTGTAISTLSGAAATNATLAWLGGGSLASGGMGMTAGAATLGLWVAGPAILVAGAIADNKADKALAEAETYKAEVEVICQKKFSQEKILKAIEVRCNEFSVVLTEIQRRLIPHLDQLESIVTYLRPNDRISDKTLASITTTLSLAKSLKDIISINIVDKNGNPTPESENVARLLP